MLMTKTVETEIDRLPQQRPTTQLRRQLGLREGVAIGIGGTVGGGIFVLVGVACGQAGPAVLIVFLLAFVASLLIALPYAELACRLPMAGGGYAFARQVLGRHWGYLNAATGFPTMAGAGL
jgi:basic amino acid/polyamine antiporter, APA family